MNLIAITVPLCNVNKLNPKNKQTNKEFFHYISALQKKGPNDIMSLILINKSENVGREKAGGHSVILNDHKLTFIVC